MKKFLCLIACLLFVACGGNEQQSDSQSASSDHADATVVVADMAVEPGPYHVACGCSIEGVGHCGNYIQVGEDYVPIANSEEMGLGKMEWCGQSDVTVVASGEIKDGEFVATSLVAQ
jgi:hypothetical protein